MSKSRDNALEFKKSTYLDIKQKQLVRYNTNYSKANSLTFEFYSWCKHIQTNSNLDSQPKKSKCRNEANLPPQKGNRNKDTSMAKYNNKYVRNKGEQQNSIINMSETKSG